MTAREWLGEKRRDDMLGRIPAGPIYVDPETYGKLIAYRDELNRKLNLGLGKTPGDEGMTFRGKQVLVRAGA